MDEYMNENTEMSEEMLKLMDDKNIQEKAEISTHILLGEGEDAHRKALNLLEGDPDDIDLIIFAMEGSVSGNFFTDVITYGNKALSWAQSSNEDLEKNNSLHLSILDVHERMARSYFGLHDFSAAKDELNKIVEARGSLPDDIKAFAIKNEYKLSGIDDTLCLADQLHSTFSDKESEEFHELKICEVQICFIEIKSLANNDIVNFPKDLSVIQAQKMAKYLLRLVNTLESIDESLLNNDDIAVLAFGKEWLVKIAIALYDGSTASSQGKAEMKINSHYIAAKDCIMVLEKLSDMSNGFAQFLLGEIYSHAYNAEPDQAKAFNYYKLAYENGMNGALTNLAIYYDEGAVTEKNTEKALEYAKKAIEQGDVRAYGILGQIYADSLGDLKQGLIWLKKAIANGDETSKNIILRLARENIENFDEKLQFVLDINERAQRDASLLDSQLELGKQYVRYYMEIERYYITPLDRLRFLGFCQDAQPETLLKYGGFVPVEYFLGQFEKFTEEMPDEKITFLKILAKRARTLSTWEMIPALADGKDCSNLGWQSVCDYIYKNSDKWGWDGYLENGEKWEYIPIGNNSTNQTPHKEEVQHTSTTKTISSDSSYASNSSQNSSDKGCYVATAVYGSYDCPEVWTLRRFRDCTLAKSWYGRAFIRLYYAISPSFVKYFGDTEWFKQFWKSKLDKLVSRLKMKGFEDSPYND